MTMPAAPADKRAFLRVPMALAGKVFFPATEIEQDCIVTDISLGGATLQYAERPVPGHEIVLYIPGFDRLAGVVARADDEEAGMRFVCSDAKRERVAASIMLFLAGAPLQTRLRRAERNAIVLPTSLTRPDGETIEFVVRDISLTGAALQTPARPPLDEIVILGTMQARVTRHFEDGIALEFVREESAAA